MVLSSTEHLIPTLVVIGFLVTSPPSFPHYSVLSHSKWFPTYQVPESRRAFQDLFSHYEQFSRIFFPDKQYSYLFYNTRCENFPRKLIVNVLMIGLSELHK